MGRIAAHTQEQVFAAADALAANGKEVSPTALRETLGRGSFSTLGKHIDAWQQARQAVPAPVILDMPDVVKAAFGQCWLAAATEAGKEIATIREKTDSEVKAIRRRLEEALSEVERLEEEICASTDALEASQESLGHARKEAQQAAKDAAASQAALEATVAQMRSQIDAQQDELARVHAEADAARSRYAGETSEAKAETERLRAQLADVSARLDEANTRERAQIKDAAEAKAEATRLADQLKDQKSRSMEVIGKLEKNKQEVSAELTALRLEARETGASLGRAQGELDALRAQVAELLDTLKRLTTPGHKKPQGGA